MFNKLILATVLVIAVCAQAQLTDPIDCFRMKDSSFGHFLTCSASKPLPLKVETTFALDKDFTWTIFSYDVALYDGVEKKTTSLSKCLQGNNFCDIKGSPGVGNKTAGSNLTLATTCNTLPRELRKYDMIRYEVHFPNTEWLIWAVPIPGYTTYEDVQQVMGQQEFNTPQMKVEEFSPEHSTRAIEFIEHVKMMREIRNNP